MDSGWAVVLGAAIAFAGTAIFPWIREGIRERRQRMESRRVEVAGAIRALVLEATAQYVAGPARNRRERRARVAREYETLIDLDLMLGIDGKHISIVTRQAFALIREVDADADARPGRALMQLVVMLPIWLRGGMTARQVRASYEERVGMFKRDATGKIEPADPPLNP